MSRTTIIGLALLVAGAIALYFGFNAANSPAGELQEAFTGEYSNRTMIYFIGGAIAAVAGAALLLKRN